MGPIEHVPGAEDRRNDGIKREAEEGSHHGEVDQQLPRLDRDSANPLRRPRSFLQRYDGATIVIKLGGRTMGSDDGEFARDVSLMKQCSNQRSWSHGGGPMINGC